MSAYTMARPGDVILLVGSRKGAFILASDPSRKSWELFGPHFPGSDVFHVTYDRRDGAVWAAVNSPVWGAEIQRSHDLGATWQGPVAGPKFADTKDMALERVWHIEPGRPFEPGVVYAGVEPAALFKSEDGGDNWAEMEGLTEHESREHWQPGFGGLCLHSIVLHPSHPDRMWVGISAAGVFGTSDGGESWAPMNRGVRADFLPDRFPEFGQCTHKLLAHPAVPDRLYQQNHCGVFRSDSAGDAWQDVTEGLPSRFGFVLGLHATDPDTVFVVPEDSALEEGEVGGGLRYVTDARFRVFRSRSAGDGWEAMTEGLPQHNAYLHLMREGMATDSLSPCGIYLGATSGQIFYSRDDGDSWQLMIDNLPPPSIPSRRE